MINYKHQLMRLQAEKTAKTTQVLVARSKVLTMPRALELQKLIAAGTHKPPVGLLKAEDLADKSNQKDHSGLIFARINSLLESLKMLSNRSGELSRLLNSNDLVLSNERRVLLEDQKDEIRKALKRATHSVEEMLSEITTKIYDEAN